MRGYVVIAAVLFCAAVGAQEGYDLQGRRVLVESARQWAAWQAPVGVHEIEDDGVVRPRFLRANTNAVADAASFSRVGTEGDTLIGGISGAGSNFASAANIIDGDETTFWEPNPGDAVESWFVEIDLGRATVVQQIAVRFVAEGDPFLKFRVMVSDGRMAFGKSRNKQFFRVGQINEPNKDQREFVFDVEPLRPVPAGVTGEVVQFVRIDAIDSDGARGGTIQSAPRSTLMSDLGE